MRHLSVSTERNTLAQIIITITTSCRNLVNEASELSYVACFDTLTRHRNELKFLVNALQCYAALSRKWTELIYIALRFI